MPAPACLRAATSIAALLLATSACASPGASTRRASTMHDANAVSTLEEPELDRMRVGRIEEMLAGRVPGLEVIQLAGGDYRLRIRGRTTILGSDEPLVLLDGMPLQAGGLSRSLAAISPSDVARIEVLKDAGATAFYGIRGANGVILITTKRAR